MPDESSFSQGQILLYQTEDGKQRIEVRLQNESVWLTQKQMAELFQTTPQNINMHLKNIFAEVEISQESVIKDSLIAASDGKQYRTQLYRLEVIIAIGYHPQHPMTQEFFKTVQNKLLYAVTGFTAAEIIYKRTDASLPNMRLTT